MNRVIVTGADGFIGSSVVKLLLQKGIEVVAIDIMDKPQRLSKHPLLSYQNIDLFDKEELIARLADHKYDTWLQFAWKGTSGSQREDYELQINNAINCLECMKVAKILGCQRYIVAGSIMEYEVDSIIHRQQEIKNKGHMYGLGKLVSHGLCKIAANEIGIDLVWGMVTNAYGPGEYSKRFINTTIRKIIKREKLEFSSGVQNYDFVYIDDVARAFYLIATYGIASCEYLIGSGKAGPLKQFVLQMLDVLNVSEGYTFGEKIKETINLPIEVFNMSKINDDTGFVPEISFKEGIKRTAEWIEKN